MTKKLYYEDAYIKEFSATVISCDKRGDVYDVILDQTAFFPEEGGQYSDKGMLGNAEVFDVREENGIIHHYASNFIAPGSEILGKIDFDERYEKMQCHTGEHILSGIIHSLFGLDNVGFHLGKEDVTMDVSAPLTRSDLDRVEKIANEIIYKNIEVTTEFPSADELSTLEYRSKLDLTENVRIVNIGEYDSCACCAPHVKYTGEIGLIKILDFAKLRGGIRIHITAGRRAMNIFREFFESAQSISSMLSVPKSDIASAVNKLVDDLAAEKSAFESYRIQKIKEEAEKINQCDGDLLLTFSDASFPELIAFSNIAVNKISGILILLSGVDGNYKYVISSSTVDLRTRIADINKNLLGRGGGRSNMVQGSFSSDAASIKAYFNL